jgi:hypothetical protein
MLVGETYFGEVLLGPPSDPSAIVSSISACTLVPR